MVAHVSYSIFLFAFGACVGSFLNVVVWRLPRVQQLAGESLLRSLYRAFLAITFPPSHCPTCQHKLAWYDNIPVFGWIALRGKCRYCKTAISARYPIVEAITGALFVLYYICFFVMHQGPSASVPVTLNFPTHWPMLALYLFTIAALLAASLIDAELFIIPIEIPWLVGIVGVIVHAFIDSPVNPGSLLVGVVGASASLGGTLGLIVSIILFKRGVIPQSFPKGEPMLEIDRRQLADELENAKRQGKKLDFAGDLPPSYSKSEIRTEIGKEMIFLMPPMAGGGLMVTLATLVPSVANGFTQLSSNHSISGLLGALLGALVGGFVVWITRILGTLGFGRVAMGLGDVHLMLGVGAVIGAGAATVSFFLAPFFGIVVAVWMFCTGTRRELPYGPYLSLATAFVMIFYYPIQAYLTPGMQGLLHIIRSQLSGGS